MAMVIMVNFAGGPRSRVVPFVSRVVNFKVGWNIHDSRVAPQSSRVARKTHERMEGGVKPRRARGEASAILRIAIKILTLT